MKYILVVYCFDDDKYRKVIGEPSENLNKMIKAKNGLDAQLNDKFFSEIEEWNEFKAIGIQQ